MIRRLRIKFVCINMTIVTMTLLVIFGALFQFTREDLHRQSKRVMTGMAQEHPKPEHPAGRPEKLLQPGFVVEIGKDGAVQPQNGGWMGLSDPSVLETLIMRVHDADQQSGTIPEYALRYLIQDTPQGRRIVFMDTSMETETLKGLAKSCFLIGLGSFAAFLTISIFLSYWAVGPVEKAWNQQRQFVADASHELKTPLTVIMTNAELLEAGLCPETDRIRFSRNIQTMSAQMRSLVESLLELARADNGTAKMTFSDVDLSALAEESLMRFEPVYFEKNRFLEGQILPRLHVRGSEDHLRQVLDILLDNGSKYSVPGSTVRVRLEKQGSQCLLQVISEGEALTKEEQRDVFKRFYRKDKARSRDGSFGLGLSIAESIVSQHRGRIWVESEEGRNTFSVQLSLLRQFRE